MTTVSMHATPRPAGIRWWARSYWLLLRWEITNLRFVLPILLIVQIALYGGSVVGLGFFMEDVTEEQALYLTTGGTLLSMMTVGLTFLPSIIAQRKATGAHDYLWSLPVPRLAMLFATLTVFVGVTVPGALCALGFAILRYDISLDVSPAIIPAIVLVLVTTTSVGAAVGHLTAQPAVTNAIGNLFVIVMFLFSPINYPAERLPQWLQEIHQWLPFQHMANLVRSGLTDELGHDVGRSAAVLCAWAVLAWLAMYRALGRTR